MSVSVSVHVETAMCMLEMSGVGVGMGVHVVGGVVWVWWASCYGNCECRGHWCCRHVPTGVSVVGHDHCGRKQVTRQLLT